ncbi:MULTISPECIES: hexose kinase [Gracilibacillus]|uniref:hexose kinase n=1 Tax=Gracilibacillus TaxID=74385 RepID=UPI000824DBFD|nr:MULTISPECIES: hexose kinase [Gracilibacillus]
MILTVTLNPSVDINYSLKPFDLDTVNRVSTFSKTAGGKGLNVARVIQQLDEKVAATGFLGGSLGSFIRKSLVEENIIDHFTSITGETRNCIAIIHEGQQTEILESGPEISEKEAEAFLDSFANLVKKADVITISGSLPKGLDTSFYRLLIQTANQFGASVLLDTKGDLLSYTIQAADKPFLIKPNMEELADLLEEPPTNEAAIISALYTETFAGIPWVVVTTGKTGAYVKQKEVIYKITPPKVEAINPVGSGDSVIAGFAAGLSKGLANEALMKYALSMGVLNALHPHTGAIQTDHIDKYVEKMKVKKICDNGRIME